MSILTPPVTYPMALAVAAEHGWEVTRYSGRLLGPAGERHYMGIVAVRGDIRVQLEWGQYPQSGDWRKTITEAALRHPVHDPRDFAAVAPQRWHHHGDRDRRCTAAGVEPALRLLGHPNDVIAAAILQPAGRGSR